jgi:hypothetical protein
MGKYGKKTGIYRSKFEKTISDSLISEDISFTYEEDKIEYIKPKTTHIYTPDFTIIKKNGEPMFIEVKGLFDADDRKKHLYIKQQHPDLDIRFIFQNSNNKITKKSKTSYSDWAIKNRFLWSNKCIPVSWLKE